VLSRNLFGEVRAQRGFCEMYARARHGVLHFDQKCLRINMELFNDDHYPLSKNWTRMSRSNLPRNALVPAND
jgi:hypothetical protein